jgi:hypothetical protein
MYSSEAISKEVSFKKKSFHIEKQSKKYLIIKKVTKMLTLIIG